ncbi:MAG TPA: hypothetical protein PLZ43_12730 [bacterium]|nr:hypothetical protein [bacterium]
MKKVIITILFAILLGGNLFGEIKVNEGDSFVEFQNIVLVGQVVEITPFSIIFENTFAETKATDEQIKNLIEYYNTGVDFRAHAFANALQVISVKDGKMRIAFYLDNITRVFSDDVKNYMQFIPLFYMFKNNINQLKVPKEVMDELKKQSLDYYLSLPMAKEMMSKAWLAGVFKIDPESAKLVYYGSRLYNNIEELQADEFAAEYRIYDVIKAGMTMTMTKSQVVGRESLSPKKKDDRKEDGESTIKGKNKFYNKKYDTSGQGK